MAARTRSLTSVSSQTLSGAGDSDGTNTGGRSALSTVSGVASGEVDSMMLMRLMVRPSDASSVPMWLARSDSDGSPPSSFRSFWRAVSSSRRTRRMPRGQAPRRNASIMAPRTRRSANVSNLMPRASSNLSTASIKPSIPSWTRSPRSIECGIEAARRRAIAPTNGTPASMRSCCVLVRV